jgi:hypothetical protein
MQLRDHVVEEGAAVPSASASVELESSSQATPAAKSVDSAIMPRAFAFPSSGPNSRILRFTIQDGSITRVKALSSQVPRPGGAVDRGTGGADGDDSGEQHAPVYDSSIPFGVSTKYPGPSVRVFRSFTMKSPLVTERRIHPFVTPTPEELRAMRMEGDGKASVTIWEQPTMGLVRKPPTVGPPTHPPPPLRAPPSSQGSGGKSRMSYKASNDYVYDYPYQHSPLSPLAANSVRSRRTNTRYPSYEYARDDEVMSTTSSIDSSSVDADLGLGMSGPPFPYPLTNRLNELLEEGEALARREARALDRLYHDPWERYGYYKACSEVYPNYLVYDSEASDYEDPEETGWGEFLETGACRRRATMTRAGSACSRSTPWSRRATGPNSRSSGRRSCARGRAARPRANNKKGAPPALERSRSGGSQNGSRFNKKDRSSSYDNSARMGSKQPHFGAIATHIPSSVTKALLKPGNPLPQNIVLKRKSIALASSYIETPDGKFTCKRCFKPGFADRFALRSHLSHCKGTQEMKRIRILVEAGELPPDTKPELTPGTFEPLESSNSKRAPAPPLSSSTAASSTSGFSKPDSPTRASAQAARALTIGVGGGNMGSLGAGSGSGGGAPTGAGFGSGPLSSASSASGAYHSHGHSHSLSHSHGHGHPLSHSHGHLYGGGGMHHKSEAVSSPLLLHHGHSHLSSSGAADSPIPMGGEVQDGEPLMLGEQLVHRRMSFKHPIKGWLNVEIRGYRSRKNKYQVFFDTVNFDWVTLTDRNCHLEENYMGEDVTWTWTATTTRWPRPPCRATSARGPRTATAASAGRCGWWRTRGPRAGAMPSSMSRRRSSAATSASAGSTAASAPPPAPAPTRTTTTR